MKNTLILLFITLFIAFACKKDNFDDQADHNYTLKTITAGDIEGYENDDTTYMKETFAEFNDDMEEYREDTTHSIDDYHIFDAYWLLFSNLNFEYGHLGDSICPDTTSTFTIIVDVIGVENDTHIVNGQSMAAEVIDAAGDISSVVPGSGIVFMITLSIIDFNSSELEIEATIHFTSLSRAYGWVYLPTSSPKPFVSGDYRQSVYDGACGGCSSTTPMPWEFVLRLNPNIFTSNTPLQNICGLSGSYFIYGDDYDDCDYTTHPNSFWKGPDPDECLDYAELNYYLDEAVDVYDDFSFRNVNRHIFLIGLQADQQTSSPNHYFHVANYNHAIFIKIPDGQ